jgi:type I restriction enzyme S subunit
LPSRAKRKVKVDDIIYSTVRPNQKHFGIIKNILPNMLVSTGFAVLRAIDNQAINKFIYYFLSQDNIINTLHAIAEQSTSAYPSIRPNDILNIDIALPPLPTQCRIAGILSALDDKIENNRKTSETLEQIAQAVFKRWFVDFDFPDERGRPYKSSGGKMVESELGLIPEGWKIKPLTEVIDFKEGPGIRNWQYTNNDEGIRFINIRCIKNYDLDLKTANRISTEEAYGKYLHFHLKENDIVISTSGTLGRIAIVRSEHLPLMLNTSVIRMRPISSFCTFSYLLGYMKSILQYELETRASGSVQKNFGPMHLKEIKMVIPPIKTLKSHNIIIEKTIFKTLSLLKQNDLLQQTRDTLLPKLMSGEVEV